MNNEPVAWIPKEMTLAKPKDLTDCIPLYTHPAKELDEQFKKGFEAGKEEGWKAHKFHHPADLTDEEIQDLWAEMDWSGQPELEFARAILRKAQEK